MPSGVIARQADLSPAPLPVPAMHSPPTPQNGPRLACARVSPSAPTRVAAWNAGGLGLLRHAGCCSRDRQHGQGRAVGAAPAPEPTSTAPVECVVSIGGYCC